MTENTKFTKREWIHLIITLSIVQAGIWFVSFVYANNSNALGYISFAGTIISIILAVLAIGYTYGESHQQKNSSITLANQLDSLVKIKDKLEVQTDSLSDIKVLIEFISDFSNKVDNHFLQTNSRIDNFSENFQSFDNKKLETTSESNLEVEDIVTTIFPNKPSQFIVLCLILSMLYWENNVQGDTLGNFRGYLRSLKIKDIDIENESIFFGGCVNLLYILTNLGVIKKQDQFIEPVLLKKFNHFVNLDDPILRKSFNGMGIEIQNLGKNSKHFIKN